MTADLSPTRRRWLLAAVMSGLLLAMLDQSIVGTALPKIVETLGGNDLYVWVATAYLVPATVMLPIYARLSDRHGRRNLLLIGMALFLLGSGLAATAQNMEQLIGYRALQGFGAGALEGLSFILVADLYAGRRNAALQGALAGLMGIAFIAGPLAGGFLTDHIGWRSVFTVNLPIGAAALAVVAIVLPASVGRSERRGTPLDLTGIALLTAGVGLLLVGLNERHVWLIAGGLVVIFGFIAVERRAVAPVIPLKLFADRKVAAIMIAGATSTFGLYAGALLLPRYFQQVRDVSATHSGLLIYPLLIGILISVNVAGMLISKRLEFRGTVLAGAGLAALGALGFATFDANTPDWQSLLFMALMGLGIGPALSGLQIALTRTLRPQQIAGGMGALLLLRQVGGAIALAGAETVYRSSLHSHTPAVSTGTGVLAIGLVGSLIAALALASLPRGAGRLPAMAVPA
ncbi:MFS transporter [Solirubrobacter soli]|uniref:MFS transporter n=1 Tax=Solirubrobacter soli TaxID=363832 RepID=UPI000404900B|nr:MFS transporter [Solirubrobacter soli]